jgi:hypothetical protein
VKDIIETHNAAPKNLDINGKVIPFGTSHKGTQDFKKKWGGFIKKECRVDITIKTLYLFKHVLKLCFIQENHVNQDGLHVHGTERWAINLHLLPIYYKISRFFLWNN